MEMQNNTFRFLDRTAYIKTRKKNQEGKPRPPLYAIFLKPGFEYISSLYPINSSRLALEYQGDTYTLELPKMKVLKDSEGLYEQAKTAFQEGNIGVCI